MSDIYQLLHIDATALRDFSLLAHQVTDRETDKIMAQSTRRLKAIEESMLTEGNIQFTQASVEEVVQKVVRCAEMEDDSSINWNSLELRIISYYPMLFQADDKSYDYALLQLDKHWKNLFFNGLVFYLLNGWNMMRTKFRDTACNLVRKKLAAYDGSNRRYLALKNHADYFEDSGPLRMATLLVYSEKVLDDSPKLIGQVPSAISLSFFSDVIVKYVEKKQIQDFEALEEIFRVHQLDRTKKLVLANLVVDAEAHGNEHEQLLVSKFGEHILGDISLAVTWSPFIGANAEQVALLKKAKELVNKWYTRRVIEVFFNVCVQDGDRKQFWLSHANFISDFRVAGSRMIQATLEGNELISSLMSRYFIKTNAKRSQTAALILSIKSRVFIEFSDVGALYVYKHESPYVSFLFDGKQTISDTRELKATYMPILVKDDPYFYIEMEEEGRMNHIGNWKNRLKKWFGRYIETDHTFGRTFSSVSEEGVFKEVPLPEQSPAPAFKQDPKFVITPKQKEVSTGRTINSKWIFGGVCRIFANADGFWIQMGNSGKKIFLKKYMPNEKLEGSLWIREAPNGWLNIIHNTTENKQLNAGFVKLSGNDLLYRVFTSQSNYRRIQL